MNYTVEAREKLSDLLLESGNVNAYLDTIWKLRYPKPAPKSSSGWPYQKVQKDFGKTKVRLVK